MILPRYLIFNMHHIRFLIIKFWQLMYRMTSNTLLFLIMSWHWHWHLTQDTVMPLLIEYKVIIHLVHGCHRSGCGAVSPGQVRHRVPHLAPRRHEPPLRREVLHQLGRPGEAGLGAGYSCYRSESIMYRRYLLFRVFRYVDENTACLKSCIRIASEGS